MSAIQEWADGGDSLPWAKVNANFQDVGVLCFAHRRAADSGLVVAYGGGNFDETAIVDGTVTCTDDDANYIVVARATGVVSTSTATTNWDNTTTYGRMATATFAAGVLLSYLDERFSPGGIFDHSTAAAGDMLLAGVQTVTGAKTFNDGKLKLAGSSSGALILAAPAAAGSGTVTLPTSGTLATTSDVTAAVNGLSWKQTVRVATTVAGTLATSFENGDTVDGVVLATGDRILIKNQASGAENGIYVVAASGAPARATDADSGAELVNASVYVAEGTANADTQWTCTTNATITVGSTSLTFAQVAAGVYQPLDSDLTSIAGLTATTDNFLQSKSSAWASRTVAQVTADLQGTGLLTDAAGFRTIPQNSQSTAYTTVAADSGKHILHPAADTNARTFTIDSNANVAYPVGTAITFINETSQVVTIAITSDTLVLAGTGTTGSRSLAQYGVATAIKITTTKWYISGTGLT